MNGAAMLDPGRSAVVARLGDGHVSLVLGQDAARLNACGDAHIELPILIFADKSIPRG